MPSFEGNLLTQLHQDYLIRNYTVSQKNVTLFTALCFSNGAVMGSLDVRLSVRPSVTLMDADHIR